ncbi:MAG TPA: DUF3768 domain-containing protein [Ktedonobacteraceae bacterium]|nr:DUF3768 domain-containing protein [Ktedonobacteraceae bacterium]
MHALTIAQLNDEFRRSGQDIVLTQGVQALSDVLGLLSAVQTFDTFTEDNDPYGEHDFGSINWHNNHTFWKIDYYDQALQYWHDPLSPDCHRILTVLLASEY